MPAWPTHSDDVASRAETHHQQSFSGDPSVVATAPVAVGLLGEFGSRFGGHGLTLATSIQVAAAIGDQAGSTVLVAENPGINVDKLTAFTSSIVTSMQQHWGVPREESGMSVAVASDAPDLQIPAVVAALGSAVALALNSKFGDRDDIPTRAKMAEFVVRAADEIGVGGTADWATTSLRTHVDQVLNINHCDGAVTQMPVRTDKWEPALALLRPNATPEQFAQTTAALARRDQLIEDACRTYGVTSLCELPDGPTRIIEWLQAVHARHTDSPLPQVAEAASWLSYLQAESVRAQTAASALRNRNVLPLIDAMNTSRRAMASDYGLALPEAADLFEACDDARVVSRAAGGWPGYVVAVAASELPELANARVVHAHGPASLA